MALKENLLHETSCFHGFEM